MKKALVFGGRGRYAHPWHDYVGTCHVIAVALAEMGLEVKVASFAAEALPHLDQVDLLVVNAGLGPAHPDSDGPDNELAAARSGLNAYLDRGGPVAALHTAFGAFWDNPRWAPMVGAQWVDDVSFHPPQGPFTANVRPEGNPLVAGMADFETVDEAYCNLIKPVDLDPYLFHRHEGTVEPLAWARQVGDSRFIYNCLGHDVGAYGPGRLALLRREVGWLLDQAL